MLTISYSFTESNMVEKMKLHCIAS